MPSIPHWNFFARSEIDKISWSLMSSLSSSKVHFWAFLCSFKICISFGGWSVKKFVLKNYTSFSVYLGFKLEFKLYTIFFIGSQFGSISSQISVKSSKSTSSTASSSDYEISASPIKPLYFVVLGRLGSIFIMC